jgi:hypothetical protein
MRQTTGKGGDREPEFLFLAFPSKIPEKEVST